MKIFLLTSCAASKKYDISDIKEALQKCHLPIPTCDLENEEKYQNVLKNFILPASKMYEGSFRFVKELATQLRNLENEVQLFIISARYGFINEGTPIIPYECTFKDLKKGEIRARSEKLKIYEKLIELLRDQEYDQSVIVLGKDYLLTVFDKLKGKDFFKELKTKELVVFGSKEFQTQISFPKNSLKFIAVRGLGDRNRKIKMYTKGL